MAGRKTLAMSQPGPASPRGFFYDAMQSDGTPGKSHTRTENESDHPADLPICNLPSPTFLPDASSGAFLEMFRRIIAEILQKPTDEIASKVQAKINRAYVWRILALFLFCTSSLCFVAGCFFGAAALFTSRSARRDHVALGVGQGLLFPTHLEPERKPDVIAQLLAQGMRFLGPEPN
jgi:hypothetical protein